MGVVLASEPDHLGSTSRRWLTLPFVSARYGNRFQISIDDGARWTAFDLGALKVGPIVEYRTSYDRRLPIGFPKIRDAVEPGMFAEITTPVAVVEARVRKAVTGYTGWSADLSVDTELPIRMPGTVGLEARAAWADHAFARSRFDVDRAVSATNGLPVYAASRYLTAGAGAEWRLPLSRRFCLSASLGVDQLLSNGNSPIVRTRTIVQSGFAVLYHFGR